MYLLMPAFNRISGKELVFDLSNYHIWKVIGITIVATLAAFQYLSCAFIILL